MADKINGHDLPKSDLADVPDAMMVRSQNTWELLVEYKCVRCKKKVLKKLSDCKLCGEPDNFYTVGE